MQGGSGCCPLDSLDEKLIEKELGWAQETVGLNSVRIWAPRSMFQSDRKRFFNQFDQFLQIADIKGIGVRPVTDTLWARDPDYDFHAAEAQKERTLGFVPGVHGGGWRTPGHIPWHAKWERIKPIMKEFVQTLLTRYKDDKRIILWDLCNEAPSDTRDLVEWMFRWAREVDPSQPLSVCWQGHDLSDVITFHTYSRPGYPTSNSPSGDFNTEL